MFYHLELFDLITPVAIYLRVFASAGLIVGILGVLRRIGNVSLQLLSPSKKPDNPRTYCVPWVVMVCSAFRLAMITCSSHCTAPAFCLKSVVALLFITTGPTAASNQLGQGHKNYISTHFRGTMYGQPIWEIKIKIADQPC